MSNAYGMPRLPSAASPRVKITLDGREVEVPGDTNVLEALETLGEATPHFCYHRDLPAAGNCRQCLVEVDGPRGMVLAPACVTPVRPAMKVNTAKGSARVAALRKGVMEFLLVNHPLDCPICDKAGECLLQDNHQAVGAPASRLRQDVGKAAKGSPGERFTDPKGQERGGKRVAIGPRVVLDQERCIACDRCVRFMRDVARSEQLYLMDRGDRTHIATFPGEALDHPYDLNVTDICPVGALTGAHFRFRQRVWFLRPAPGVCAMCTRGCNLTAWEAEGTVWRYTPRRNPAVNASWMCNAGRLSAAAQAAGRLSAGRRGARVLDATALRAELQALLAASPRTAVVLGGESTVEDLAAALALAEADPRVTVFDGTDWTAPMAPDGILHTGDLAANRRGLSLARLPGLADLAGRAGEFGAAVFAGLDPWNDDAAKAAALDVIPERVLLTWAAEGPGHARATLLAPCPHPAEQDGVLVNVDGRVQLNTAACPPPAGVVPAWRLLLALVPAGRRPSWPSAAAAFEAAARRLAPLAGLTHAALRGEGRLIGGAP